MKDPQVPPPRRRAHHPGLNLVLALTLALAYAHAHTCARACARARIVPAA